MTVTGELLKEDFEARRLVIRYAPTGGQISCLCEPSLFDAAIRNYDVPVQVTGRYTLDRRGNPTRLAQVTRVEPIDLTPMTLSRIEWKGRTLVLNPAIEFIPSMDEESGQFYVVTNDELGIDVFARTRDELSDELTEQLLFLWDTYAQEDPTRLSRGARRLREILLARVSEENVNAALSEGH
jgi:hypothetical protein